MHQSVVDASEIYLQELSRHNYVTPTSYLELLASYSMLMTKKRGELAGNVQRLQSDEAMPALMAAESSLKALNKGDISEVRALKRPPLGVHLVMEAICIVKDVKPNKIPGNMPGEKILDYWEPGRNLLQNPDQFLHSLMEFDKEGITEAMIVSKACTSLCMWVHAMYKYYFVNKAVAPKKAALKAAMEDLAETEKILNEAKTRMKVCQDRLSLLEKNLQETEAKKADLEDKMRICEERMDRAVRLVTGLADERERWIDSVAAFKVSIFNLVGDILISAGAVAYLSPFTDRYRRGLLDEWSAVLKEKKVPHTPGCSPVTTLGEAVTIRQWQLDGLPRDFLSTENAVLVMHSKRWPLFIDPQGQANRWIRNMGKESGMAISKLSDKELLRTLESSIRFGKPMLIENVGVELDPALDPVLQRLTYRQAGQVVIKLGDAVIPYSEDFRLFITTRLPNPHYTPEVSIKVLVVNFTLVPSGLQDQLLALVVMEERADLEEARSAIIISSAQMKHDLKECEDKILYRLSAAEGSPVDDIDLITTLEASKATSEDIKVKVEAAEKTQVDIDATRAQYIPVANRGQILFFCVSDLANVDPMYQYSLEWFVKIFVNSMVNTEKTTEILERVQSINDYFTFSLYSNICRSLFEKHKLHFAFLLCARILMDEGKIDPYEWRFLLSGGSPLRDVEKPSASWISPRGWKEILSLENMEVFVPFVQDFAKRTEEFVNIVNSAEPHRVRLPSPWDKQLDDFQRMLVLKCLRPDKVTNAMQDYLTVHLGERFVEPQTTDLTAMFAESGPAIPLVFVLSTGTDPAADLYKFADKANLLRAYSNQVSEFQDFMNSEHEKVHNFKLLLFSLCLFHGVCLERRKFGPLGFNIPYEFTDGDLRICISQLHMFLLEYDIVPFKLPTSKMLDEYLFYIRSLPINDDPELFGLHPNADISYAQSETLKCLATLLALQPRVVGGAAQSQEEVTTNIALSIDAETPLPFTLEDISAKYPVLYEESLNTVLVQEVIRFNRLLRIIHSSLKEMLKALKGIVVMSQALENMGNSLFTNRVPEMWASKAYPSLKPLGPWVQDLKARIDFLNDWIANGIPPVFWISGFYFPQAFLTGTLQNFARKYVVSIDAISFGFKVLDQSPKKRPADGCCIWGLFVEGARWNETKRLLDESRPKELYTVGIYECPVYKTLTRAGTLSTTGHSTNYVVAIEIPSNKTQTHWIKRGVALICALNY
ncbi:Dynein heavy chain 1 [Blattella germanica]|nr:Dynein heavy chain 1 [Blattella germanica]